MDVVTGSDVEEALFVLRDRQTLKRLERWWTGGSDNGAADNELCVDEGKKDILIFFLLRVKNSILNSRPPFRAVPACASPLRFGAHYASHGPSVCAQTEGVHLYANAGRPSSAEGWTSAGGRSVGGRWNNRTAAA